MSELDELYQEVILDHNKSPRNFRAITDADRKAEGYNPLCGDQVTVYLKMENGIIKDVSFQGSGQHLQSLRVLMTAELKGKTESEVEHLFGNVHRMLTGTSVDGDETKGGQAGDSFGSL
jgi:nitrogen fixation NifU-like protein